MRLENKVALITGGGSGGTVAVLGRRGADIGHIADAYAAETGLPPRVFSGSSPGAAGFHLRLGPGNGDGPGARALESAPSARRNS